MTDTPASGAIDPNRPELWTKSGIKLDHVLMDDGIISAMINGRAMTWNRKTGKAIVDEPDLDLVRIAPAAPATAGVNKSADFPFGEVKDLLVQLRPWIERFIEDHHSEIKTLLLRMEGAETFCRLFAHPVPEASAAAGVSEDAIKWGSSVKDEVDQEIASLDPSTFKTFAQFRAEQGRPASPGDAGESARIAELNDFAIGDVVRVRVSPEKGWTADCAGIEGKVRGLVLDRDDKPNIWVRFDSDSGDTDGFVPDDLCLARRATQPQPPQSADARVAELEELLRQSAVILDKVWPCGSDSMRQKQGTEKWSKDNETHVFAPTRALLPRIKAALAKEPRS